jgi:hypothetical protein
MVSCCSDGLAVRRAAAWSYVLGVKEDGCKAILVLFIYITRLASNEIFSPLKQIHGKVGRAKDLSEPR